MPIKFTKTTISAFFALSLVLAFSSGWYLGGQHNRLTETYASLGGVSDCQGSSCSIGSSYFLLSNIINAEKGKTANVDFAPFWKTWQILNQRYVNGTAAINSTSTKKVTDQDRVWGAISGMVSSLGDPYTVFMPPKEKTRFEEDIRGNFSGVGMEVGMKDGVPTVISPLSNSPAKKAGILAGDKVLKIDGVSVSELVLDEVINKIRGPEGTVVTLTILHDKAKDPKDIKITRAVITIPTIDTKIVTGRSANDKIFVINLYNFSAQSADLFRDAINQFVKSGSHKLILDLRGNPGGYLDAAVDMASWFLPAGKAVVRETTGQNQAEKVYRSVGYDTLNNKNLKMVVLVDKGSASASEILAGALSEYGVAKLVGEKTFGKGSVQELVAITEDSSLKVTIARWLTPKGKSLSQNGLDPDIVVKMPEMSSTSTIPAKDLQFEKAVEILRDK